jgi:hypothetical protein
MNRQTMPRQMMFRRALLFSYRVLLYFYPYTFRKRFATEMLQLAAEAAPCEWPLILGDTSLAIVRSWVEPHSSSSISAPASKDAYIAIGGSALSLPRLFQGLALALVIVLGVSYVGSLEHVELPQCHAVAAQNISW